MSKEGNAWFEKALVAYRLQCWDQLHKDIIKNLDADPEDVVGKKLAKQWRDLILEHCLGGGSKDFHFGIKLLMESAKAKVALQNSKGELKPEQHQKILQDAMKMLLDPMVTSWIEKALREGK